MVDLRKSRFNRARIKRIIDAWKKNKTKPEWADTLGVTRGRLFVNGLEVVASEDVDDWLRARVYDKNSKPFSLSRDSGYTDHVAKETLGISRRKWYDWLASQDIHQRFSVRPKPLKSAGQRLKKFGHCEMDLVEVKQKDVPSRTTDTFIFTFLDRLSSFLCALRIDTKAIDPPTKRGTLTVFKELLAQMNAVLPTKVHEISMDGGSEFKGALERYMKQQGIKKKVVPLGAAIESRNGVLQRKLYRLINLKRKGGFDKHLKEAVELCNQTTNKVTKVPPNQAVKMEAADLEKVFNSFRQKPGKQIGPRLKKGDTVLVMQSHAVKKKGAFYKSYRDHWSTPKKIQRVQGNGIFIDGKSVPRNRVKKVRPVDQKSMQLLESPKRIRKAKRKSSPVKLRQRSTRAGARDAKARMKGMK
jgi:hypothetical protein